MYERHFSTKTPYFYNGFDKSKSETGECRDIHLQGVVRHGARNPGVNDVALMKLLRDFIEAEEDTVISRPELTWMQDWKPRYKTEDIHLLTDVGENELYNLAKRVRQYFAPIFLPEYRASVYKFQQTQVSRTGQSAAAFVYGLFEGTGNVGKAKYQPVDITSETIATDLTLRFYSVCKEYKRFHKSEDTTKEVKQFKKSDLVKALISTLTDKMGVNVDFSKALAMYRACSYDTYFEGTLSPWCKFLGEDGLQVLEYHDDLKQWWVKSYGHVINYRIACPLLHSIVDQLERAWEAHQTSKQVQASIRFGHAETMQPLISLLGLFNDTYGLYANSTYETLLSRKYRSSLIVPYAANVFFSLLNCEGTPFVKMYVNEVDTRIPGCVLSSDTKGCSLAAFKQAFSTILSECDFESMCNTQGHRPRPQENPGADILEGFMWMWSSIVRCFM
eukprot:CFRG7601T1